MRSEELFGECIFLRGNVQLPEILSILTSETPILIVRFLGYYLEGFFRSYLEGLIFQELSFFSLPKLVIPSIYPMHLLMKP